MASSFGSSNVVSEARRCYLGGNPTGRGRLWCARFMNMVLQHSGYRGTGSDMANSFAKYGQRVFRPAGRRDRRDVARSLRAEALALAGDLEGASTLIPESVARIEAGEERSHYAEVLRLRGWILIMRGEPDQAAATLRKAIAVARDQQSQILGASCRDDACAPAGKPRRSRGSDCRAGARLRLVYRRPRHQGFEGGCAASGRSSRRPACRYFGIAQRSPNQPRSTTMSKKKHDSDEAEIRALRCGMEQGGQREDRRIKLTKS